MKTLIATATYNEVDNIERLINEIFHYAPGTDILIVDDNSPDGTGDVLEKLKKAHPQLKVINRSGKLGLGTAHLEMMKVAINQNYDALITMDADFSHHPRYLPTLLKHLEEGHEFVIGSRYTQGGKSNYGPKRHAISLTANFLARLMLNIPLQECTTSYRGFKISLLRQLNLNAISSNGYSFFVESLFTIVNHTEKLKEFPILFEDRRAGASKINKTEIFKSILMLVRLFYKRITRKTGAQRSH